jgi:predicted DNA-binding ribbon-helix-helix protein
MPKQKLTLSIYKEIISQAKSQNINLSSFLEIHLIDYLSDKEKCSRRDYVLIVQCSHDSYNTKDILGPDKEYLPQI